MEEIWRDIPGYEGYQASNTKQIRSVDRVVVFSNGTQHWYKGQIMKQQVYDKYHRLKVGGKMEFVHKLVALAFPDICGVPFEGSVIDHIDRNPENNVPENLRYVTCSENTRNSDRCDKTEEYKKQVRDNNQKRYREKNKDRILNYRKNYRAEHREELSKKDKEYYESNKSSVLKRCKEYYELHKEEISLKRKERYKKKKGLV